MDEKMIDRLFNQIDLSASKVETLSRIVYENANTLGIVSKVVFFILLAILSGAITLGWNAMSPKQTNPSSYCTLPTHDKHHREGDTCNGIPKSNKKSK
jgi:hypothetical protein